MHFSFPLNTNMSLHSLFVCMVSEEKSAVILIFAFPLVRCFSSGFIQDFVFSFCSLCMKHFSVNCWNLSYCVFYELLGSVVWCLTLIWEKRSVIIASHISCTPFFFLSFWYSCDTYVTRFVVSPQFLDSLFCFGFFSVSLFSLLFHSASFY